MTMTDEPTRSGNALVDELRTWLEENWDPDLTVGEWWERLGMAGWSAPMLPEGLLRTWPVAGRLAGGLGHDLAFRRAGGARRHVDRARLPHHHHARHP